MNDEKEVEKVAEKIVSGGWTNADDYGEISDENWSCLKLDISEALEAHGKSCYERGLKNGDWQKDNRIELEGQITRLKERVAEAEKKQEWKYCEYCSRGFDPKVDRLANSWEKRTVEEIAKMLTDLAFGQFNAIQKAVEKKGLMKTTWDDIDSEGGSLDFKVIATALVKFLEEKRT